MRAVAHGEIITCPDIAEEKRFDPQWQRLCLDHGIRSLQSRPVYLRGGMPYATFVLAYRQPREETAWDVALMTFAADAAGLIIQSALDRTNIAAEERSGDARSRSRCENGHDINVLRCSGRQLRRPMRLS